MSLSVPPEAAAAADACPYALVERIGKGSFGNVFKGTKKSSGEIVAIKVLDLDTDEDEIFDVRKEINLLSTCDSPHVTRYHGSFLVGTRLWIIMDYAGGGSIRGILKSGPIDEIYIAIIVREVLLALVYLHKSVNIIHRDIKAANILLTSDGSVKLCDFGVAGQITMTSARRNSFVGTPYWMAPEIIKRSQYDFKADIWSLGITVIEMATGNPPFADQDPRRALFLIPRARPPKLEGRFSASIQEFIGACLKEEPEDRPTAESLLKFKFVKDVGRGTLPLLNLLARHAQWKDENADTDEEIPFESILQADSESQLDVDDDWVFDTVRPQASKTMLDQMDEDSAQTPKMGSRSRPNSGAFNSNESDMQRTIKIKSSRDAFGVTLDGDGLDGLSSFAQPDRDVSLSALGLGALTDSDHGENHGHHTQGHPETSTSKSISSDQSDGLYPSTLAMSGLQLDVPKSDPGMADALSPMFPLSPTSISMATAATTTATEEIVLPEVPELTLPTQSTAAEDEPSNTIHHMSPALPSSYSPSMLMSPSNTPIQGSRPSQQQQPTSQTPGQRQVSGQRLLHGGQRPSISSPLTLTTSGVADNVTKSSQQQQLPPASSTITTQQPPTRRSSYHANIGSISTSVALQSGQSSPAPPMPFSPSPASLAAQASRQNMTMQSVPSGVPATQSLDMHAGIAMQAQKGPTTLLQSGSSSVPLRSPSRPTRSRPEPGSGLTPHGSISDTTNADGIVAVSGLSTNASLSSSVKPYPDTATASASTTPMPYTSVDSTDHDATIDMSFMHPIAIIMPAAPPDLVHTLLITQNFTSVSTSASTSRIALDSRARETLRLLDTLERLLVLVE